MHHFWTIPELLAQVLDYLSNQDRHAMSQVCQVFWLPAARLLWREIPRFSDLLLLFPEERQIPYREFLPITREVRPKTH